jgi:DNA-binding NtrC family response regulator
VLTEARPDLVLGEVRLPDARLFALLDDLAATPTTARLPVLVCSGTLHAIEAAAERLTQPHIAVLLKPFDIDELLVTVHRLLAAGGAVG